ncbi:berberine bridge enzyme-like 8 [Momordica charantia]|uniref:Berberine bridge enzyme-like 8 n=1 Tax=Momordica charantia TaxID=3673 RepID=A0A6J1CZP7_MOMCH|nr:berberine bridge enzyme-like 8 [Momordica charantia]
MSQRQPAMAVPNSPTIPIFLALLLLLASMAASAPIPSSQILLECLTNHSSSSAYPISKVTFFPDNPSFIPTLKSYIRNLRFTSPTTPKPVFIIAPTHTSHIQASVTCCKIHGLEIRTRSGGHDYDGLSYVSDSPFVLLDMFNLRAVTVDLKDESAWVESGATLGEVYFKIGEKSKLHGFPAGVCPTVGVGGHVSGAGYGSLMRKFGVSVDYILDATMVGANGTLLDRKSMGEDLFWAIRGGGGASFGVIVSWKFKLVPLPEKVTVFRIERTMEEGAVDILYKWQEVAPKTDENLFIRVVFHTTTRKTGSTILAKFISLFVGDAQKLFALMSASFPELGVKAEDCKEMSWIETVLFWSNYPIGTPLTVLQDRQPKSEAKFLKKKSDYVQTPIPRADLEAVMKKMIEMGTVALTFNPYGGKMDALPETATPFPFRVGNLYKIQYSAQWKEEGDAAAQQNLKLIRDLYELMTPYVSKSPRCAYLNYRDVDLGVNGKNGSATYEQASAWGIKYFKGNFEKLVKVKTAADPENFFRCEQCIPPVATT